MYGAQKKPQLASGKQSKHAQRPSCHRLGEQDEEPFSPGKRRQNSSLGRTSGRNVEELVQRGGGTKLVPATFLKSGAPQSQQKGCGGKEANGGGKQGKESHRQTDYLKSILSRPMPGPQTWTSQSQTHLSEHRQSAIPTPLRPITARRSSAQFKTQLLFPGAVSACPSPQ